MPEKLVKILFVLAVGLAWCGKHTDGALQLGLLGAAIASVGASLYAYIESLKPKS